MPSIDNNNSASHCQTMVIAVIECEVKQLQFGQEHQNGERKPAESDVNDKQQKPSLDQEQFQSQYPYPYGAWPY